MKLILVSVCVLLGSFHATQALHCMQGTELIDLNGAKQDEKKTPEYAECSVPVAIASAAALAVLKPNTITFPSTEYKCFHLRLEESKTNTATIVKGCIYKNQDVCDGKLKADTLREAFCSQCDEDRCNSSVKFGSNWKMFSLTIVAIVCYLMK